MDWWWYMLILGVVLAVIGIVFMRSRTTDGTADTTVDAPRNYTTERETARTGGLSEEDRTWEAASQERNRQKHERDSSPPGRGSAVNGKSRNREDA